MDINNFVDVLLFHASKTPDKEAYLFLDQGETITETISYAQLAERAQALAVNLLKSYPKGTRVMLLFPSCIDYMVAFFGCLFAEMIAVPVFPPRGRKHNSRLDAIVSDSSAKVALTSDKQLALIEDAIKQSQVLSALDLMSLDKVHTQDSTLWTNPNINGDQLAFLQYTSGSTGTPKGVMVTHGNLISNEKMIQESFHSHADTVYLTWLPIYHDMGLIGNMLHSLWLGAKSYFMAPVAFLQRPARWLEAVSRYRATISGAPNFAYQLCVEKIPPAQRKDLDLSHWEVAFNGSEPVRQSTLDLFSEAFSSCGFRSTTPLPCYGMAETTLIVSGGRPDQQSKSVSLDSSALGQRRIVKALFGEPSQTLVACGSNLSGQTIRIVNPQTLTLCSADEMGEIWVAGPHIAQGYWQRPEVSEEIFQAHISDTGEGPFLRTGDLGFIYEDEVYIGGRLKDVIIVNGVNYYPQDVELVAEKSSEAVSTAGTAAFAISKFGEAPKVVVVAEIERTHLRRFDKKAIEIAMRQAVFEQCELMLSDCVFIRPGTLPKTSSGKVQRSLTQRMYLEGHLPIVVESKSLELA